MRVQQSAIILVIVIILDAIFPIPYSLLPTPYSLFPVPYSLLPTPFATNITLNHIDKLK
ncbi:hypothetical protein [Moorena sp. SIO3H5]|uniref:hypothetical protein n=1 Tax=Moorena sp. SIO3H5 TaxID=2607834 RepID=UPI0025CE08D6|nr:hypothetical protein [Moorena sp. SIO3H5]